MHEALREVLGTHVAQKGSLVAPDRLRFDFSHPKPMSAEELGAVEAMANEIVVQNSPVTTRLMSVDDAIAEGAMALFGEKYGDEVRVVSMGTGLAGRQGRQALFGRTLRRHACRGDRRHRPGASCAEGAVAAGVRRIEALTGEAARRLSRRAGPAVEGGCGGAEGRAGRRADRGSKRWSRSGASWSAN